MARKPPSELTQNEIKLLKIAAKFLSAMKHIEEVIASPTELDNMEAYVQAELYTIQNSINTIFMAYTGTMKMPRIHPILQALGKEWKEAGEEDCFPDWFLLYSENITRLCEQVQVEHPDWHPDLSSVDLVSYMSNVRPSEMWWLREVANWPQPSHSSVDAIPSQGKTRASDPDPLANIPSKPPYGLRTRVKKRPATPDDPVGGSTQMSGVPRVKVEQASPPRPTQRQRTDSGAIIAYGKHKVCEPPASWALPLHLAMESRAVSSARTGSPAVGESRISELEHKVDALESALQEQGQTVARVLFEVVNGRQDAHDTLLIVSKLLSNQGTDPASLPGIGAPPSNCRSPSPMRSQGAIGKHWGEALPQADVLCQVHRQSQLDVLLHLGKKDPLRKGPTTC
ncbi:hypothetical protein EDB85DRAFT_1892798 [Lactarius pseudohatsudake]|nr:hypothetical protein EDB85DRAFT_1892798 [Lactarius pseudohatsudake]